MKKTIQKCIVNGLTLSRIISAAVVPFLVGTANIPGLFGYFAFIFFTDFLDGRLARKWEVQTVGGALLDPLCDKVLAFSFLFALINTEYLLTIPLVLESAIMVTNVIRGLNNQNAKSSKLGKAKTWFLSIALLLTFAKVLNPALLDRIFNGLDIVKLSVASASVMQTATLVNYIKEGKNAQSQSQTKARLEELKSAREILTRLFDETKFEEDKDKPVYQLIKKDRK